MMAYPYDDKRIILALQIDHSRVAGFFAAHWGNKDFDRPSPYDSVVLAAGEHDIGWWNKTGEDFLGEFIARSGSL
jgi:hypothetical protein